MRTPSKTTYTIRVRGQQDVIYKQAASVAKHLDRQATGEIVHVDIVTSTDNGTANLTIQFIIDNHTGYERNMEYLTNGLRKARYLCGKN